MFGFNRGFAANLPGNGQGGSALGFLARRAGMLPQPVGPMTGGNLPAQPMQAPPMGGSLPPQNLLAGPRPMPADRPLWAQRNRLSGYYTP